LYGSRASTKTEAVVTTKIENKTEDDKSEYSVGMTDLLQEKLLIERTNERTIEGTVRGLGAAVVLFFVHQSPLGDVFSSFRLHSDIQRQLKRYEKPQILKSTLL
jgi:hypothetical protein